MIDIRPITRDEANLVISFAHRHHKPVRSHRYAMGGFRGDGVVAAVVVGNPVAAALQDGVTFEVLRLCVVRRCCRGPERYAASRLLGAAWRAARAMGVRRLVSYTRADEDGTCYQAASWREVAEVNGEAWDHGNKADRWLPGLYEPTTEIVDRVRWEMP